MDLRTSKIVGADIHHSGSTAMTGPEIREYHMRVKGYGDIAYNAVGEKDGSLFLGRDEKYKGAHNAAPGHNNSRLGYCFAGDFTQECPTQEQYETCARWLREKSQQYGFAINACTVEPHNASFNTDCPGPNLDMGYLVALAQKPEKKPCVVLDGGKIEGKLIDGHIWTPLRPLADLLGRSVAWSAERHVAVLSSSTWPPGKQGTPEKPLVCAGEMVLDGRTVDGSTWVPAAPVVRAFGLDVTWDEGKQTATICERR